MTGTDDKRGCDQREQAGAFVLAALDSGEAERYARHLSECAACRDDVARLQPAADALATGVPSMRAPEALRARVMAQVRAEAELFTAAGAQADRPTVKRWRPTRRLALIGTTGALVLGVAAGAVVVDIADRTPGAQTIQASVAVTAPGARAQLRRTGARAVLIVTGMPLPPAGKIYQVWLARAGQQPRPTDALFSVAADGSGSIDVPGDLSRVSRVLVTAEPDGGSLHPTSAPIIVARL